jgi:hypothetical protein
VQKRSLSLCRIEQRHLAHRYENIPDDFRDLPISNKACVFAHQTTLNRFSNGLTLNVKHEARRQLWSQTRTPGDFLERRNPALENCLAVQRLYCQANRANRVDCGIVCLRLDYAAQGMEKVVKRQPLKLPRIGRFTALVSGFTRK